MPRFLGTSYKRRKNLKTFQKKLKFFIKLSSIQRQFQDY